MLRAISCIFLLACGGSPKPSPSHAVDDRPVQGPPPQYSELAKACGAHDYEPGKIGHRLEEELEKGTNIDHRLIAVELAHSLDAKQGAELKVDLSPSGVAATTSFEADHIRALCADARIKQLEITEEPLPAKK